MTNIRLPVWLRKIERCPHHPEVVKAVNSEMTLDVRSFNNMKVVKQITFIPPFVIGTTKKGPNK